VSNLAAAELENALKDLPAIGTLVKDRGYRQVWRFQAGGKAYFLKFYPRAGSAWKRLIRGNPGMREFSRLVMLQKANIPSPRAVAVLSGFRLKNQLGDAVIIDAIEPAVQLDHYLSDLELRGEAIPNHRELVQKVIDLVHQLSQAKLGHSDLHLGNFLLSGERIFLLDGYAVRTSGLQVKDILLLGHSARRFATTGDLLRGWNNLTTGGAMPMRNSASPRFYRKFLERTTRNNHYFGKMNDGGWSGHFVKQMKFSRRFSIASRMMFDQPQWQEAWRDLLARIDADQLDIIKRSRSGDVLSGEMVLGGRPISVIVKRPKKKFWYRHLNSIGRAGRARRSWTKAWKLYIRGIHAEFPLLLMEKSTLGYVTDSIIVFEQMRGETLAKIDLDALQKPQREMMFHRVGRTLRKLEANGFAHFDAKATNWIIQPDEKSGAVPILIDVDGVRHYSWRGAGIERLLRSMRDHPQYTPADSLAMCLGYAPRAKLRQEMSPQI
jgi:tRNA A-37 threonylcarbamoyl transferase component Bud32